MISQSNHHGIVNEQSEKKKKQIPKCFKYAKYRLPYIYCSIYHGRAK